MSRNLDVYRIGATLITVGVSTAVLYDFTSLERCNSIILRKQSGGTLAICNAQGQTVSQGYVVGETETISVNGPARFFLDAAGSPVVVQAIVGYSKGD